MKKAKLLACTIICLCFVACKKEKRYSTWNVNGEGFSTNEVEEVVGKAQSVLYTNSKENGFSLNSMHFYGGASSDIGCGSDPSDVCVIFYSKGKTYTAKPITPAPVITISNPNNDDRKKTLSMSPTWFVNTTSADDTVLISAILSEP